MCRKNNFYSEKGRRHAGSFSPGFTFIGAFAIIREIKIGVIWGYGYGYLYGSIGG
jgi:hypothetical protein